MGGVVTVLLTACGAGASSTPSATPSIPTGSTNVRLPAHFTILQSGAVSPAVVSVRGQIPLELIVVSQDGRAHRARLDTPASPPISVPANGRVEQLLPALPAGTYRLLIDGRPRAALHVRAG
jgi:hypothetical protein